MPHDATVAVPTAISDRDAHLDRAADAEVVVTTIDAEARRRRKPIRARVPIDDQVRQDRLDDLSPPPRRESIIATPDTAVWHTNNDFDEQEAKR